MTALLCLFTILFLLGSFGIPRALSKDRGVALSHDATATINGYFISLVFLRHLAQYIPEASFLAGDDLFLRVDEFLGQLIVATFLFFSGFGAMESIKRKGEQYIRNFPLRRILPFLLDVWLALGVYIVVRLVRGSSIPAVSTLLLSMVGWKGIGNSNWYIFAILAAWICTYLAFRIFPRKEARMRAVALLTALLLFYSFVVKHEQVGTRFYNTILCYPAGMVLSLAIDSIRAIAARAKYKRLLLLLCTFCIALVFYLLKDVKATRLFLYNAKAIAFSLLVVLLSLYTSRIGTPFLWAGKNLFYLYIYQRVPMILFSPLARTHTLMYIALCLVAVIPFCILMSKVHVRWRGFLLGTSAPSRAVTSTP